MATQVVTTDERSGASVPALTPEGERFALRQRQAKMFAMSPLVPEHLRKGSPEQAIANCWIALTLAEAMGEVPLIVMQNIHVVNGKAGFASQYMIARANSSGIFKGRIDWRIDRGDENNLAVTAYAVIKETNQEVSVTCDMKMAKAEQWTKNAKYTTMPEVMLRYRSAAFLVRFYAPDVMLGYQTVEEVEDVVAAATPSAPPLNARMLIEQSQPIETVDQTTGEVIEHEQNTQEASGTAREAPGAEESTSATSDTVGASTLSEGPTDEPDTNTNDAAPSDGQAASDDPHPAEAKAAEIIAAIEAAAAVMDVTSIVARNNLDIAAMPDELAVKIEIAADKRKRAIEAERAAAKPVQGELA
jgi:hypothetical protein